MLMRGFLNRSEVDVVELLVTEGVVMVREWVGVTLGGITKSRQVQCIYITAKRERERASSPDWCWFDKLLWYTH